MATTIRPLAAVAIPVVASRPPADPIAVTGVGLFDEHELVAIEARYADGLTSAQIVDAFNQRGLRLSEATFRKYVQCNLLPRSRRVGRKGKHQGSRGLYPAATVRRLNAIKRLLAEGLTIEDIQRSLSGLRDELATLERGLHELFDGFERELRGGQFDAARRRVLAEEIAGARRDADDLFRSLGRIERAIATGGHRPGSAEERKPDEDLV